MHGTTYLNVANADCKHLWIKRRAETGIVVQVESFALDAGSSLNSMPLRHVGEDRNHRTYDEFPPSAAPTSTFPKGRVRPRRNAPVSFPQVLTTPEDLAHSARASWKFPNVGIEFVVIPPLLLILRQSSALAG